MEPPQQTVLLGHDLPETTPPTMTSSWRKGATALAALLGLASPTSPAADADLVAELDYGSFRGARSARYNISYWQKIPYAAPPLGENRFRAPQPPVPIVDRVYDSSQPFDMCPQRTVNGSEDCLYLGLYGRPWKPGQPLRPVVVSFYGGAFIQGSASFTLPPPAYPILNVSDSADLVFVYPNYRVNAFGFLAGKEVAADPLSDANAGLLDQEFALKWTQRHIAKFGGDPGKVTVWGQSAGGGGVVAQAIARRHDPPLFRAALASSPFWPKAYRADAPETQWIYDAMANRTGCAGPGSLACLKRADVQSIRDASLYVAGSHTYATSSYTWAPVIDGDFLPLSLSEASRTGRVNIQVGFGMYNAREGENFTPGGLGSGAAFGRWLAGFLPGLAPADLARVEVLYPPEGSTETMRYSTGGARAGLIYRDVVLACPAYWMAGAAPKGAWLGEYTISPAQHASDTYWWNRVDSRQQTDPLHYKGYTGAMASFFATGDPNALKLSAGDVPGVPDLKRGKEFVVASDGFDNLNITQFERRCGLWMEMAPKIPL